MAHTIKFINLNALDYVRTLKNNDKLSYVPHSSSSYSCPVQKKWSRKLFSFCRDRMQMSFNEAMHIGLNLHCNCQQAEWPSGFWRRLAILIFCTWVRARSALIFFTFFSLFFSFGHFLRPPHINRMFAVAFYQIRKNGPNSMNGPLS